MRPATRFPAVLFLVAAGACGTRPEGAAPRLVSAPDELFAPGALPRFELVISEDAMRSLDDKPRKPVPADFIYRGARWKNVAVRFKGHRAMRDWDGKPAFKIEFDRFQPGRTFLGLRSLTLNNLVEDPTMVRETLAYRLFKEAGVPAPRTGWAELVINGEPWGLYLDVESLDDQFLVAHLGAPSNMYEGEYGCDLYPEDVWGFDQDAGDDHSRADLAALARAVAAHDPRLLGGDAPLLDLPRVLAYLATSALVSDFDGYRHSHNYRLARDPASGRWLFLPWGLDRTFKKRLDLYDSDGLIARRCFADAACRAAYDRTIVTLAGRFAAMDLPRVMDELVASIDKAAQRDDKKPYDAGEMKKKRAELRAYLSERWQEAAGRIACLDGETERDADGDGFGCLDCDDASPGVHPGVAEVCDGVDNDCSGYVDDAPACGCPALTIAGRELRLCDFPMDWWDAAAFCEGMRMHLARVDSRAESRALYDAAVKVRDERWWIGLNDLAEEGTFVWRDGSPVTFTRWSKNQPDNDACNEDCVALKDGGKGRWHDTHCGQRRSFICAPPGAAARPEDEPDTPEPEPDPTAP